LLDLYRFRFDAGHEMPSQSEIDDALRLVGYDRVVTHGSAVSFDGSGIKVTLDAIAKGYIVDRTINLLRRGGADRVMVDAGGDIGTLAGADDPWVIALQDPKEQTNSLGAVRLAGNCCATSGDYMQAFVSDRSLHHIIDPRTGRSQTETSAVSVVADSLTVADAASTSAMVLGIDDGLAFLEDLPGVEGMIVSKTGQRYSTRGFDALT
jgi:thiamine biosynthesis lipoprotein